MSAGAIARARVDHDHAAFICKHEVDRGTDIGIRLARRQPGREAKRLVFGVHRFAPGSSLFCGRFKRGCDFKLVCLRIIERNGGILFSGATKEDAELERTEENTYD